MENKKTTVKSSIAKIENEVKTKKKITGDKKDKLSDTKTKSLKEKSVTKVIINSKSMTKKEALEKAEEKLAKVFNKVKEKDIVHISKDLDLDETELEAIKKLKEKGIEFSFPNLKYAKSKYSNVSELIKYVESDKPQEGGVKIIIMNFND